LKKSVANHRKKHNVEKYIQWVTTLVHLRLAAVVACQICETPKFSENSNLELFKVIQDHRWCQSKVRMHATAATIIVINYLFIY